MEEEETENVENNSKDAHQEPSTSASVSLLSVSTSGDVRLPRKRCRQHGAYACPQCLSERRKGDGGDVEPPDISSTTPDVSESPSGSRRRKSRPVRVMRACTAPAVPCQPYDCLPPPQHFPRETVKRQQCHPAFHCKKQRLCNVVSSSWEQPDTAASTILHTQTEEPDSSTHPSIKSEPACYLSSSMPDSHPYYQHPAQPHYSYNMLLPYPQSQPPPQPQYGFTSYPAAQHQAQPQYPVLQYSQPPISTYSSASSSTVSEPQEGIGYSKLEPVCPDSVGGEEESRLGETELAAYKNKMDNVRCGVCGDAAAGFHCGAYVCEACKKFYIRSTKADNSSRYQCSKSGQCEISKDTRTHCQYCRYKKCEVLGMYPPGSKPSENSNISVIPCRVCGANSSGFHFGAITCEGCKGFFRRTVNERESNRYQCSKGGICDITVTTRNNCKSCRYKKCRSVGMSKDGSRIGRQPNAIKHMCAKEIEAIQSLTPFSALPIRVKPPPTVAPPLEVLESREEVEQRAFLCFRNRVVLASRHLFAMIEDSLMPARSRLSRDMPRELVWNVMMEFFDTHACHVARFMNGIPGFIDLYKKLRSSSKLLVVQEAMYPIMLIMLGQNYDVTTGAYNYFSFLPCDKDVIMTTFPSLERICSHLSASGRLIKRIGFDNIEVALLCAIEVSRNELMDEDKQRLLTVLYERCLHTLDFYMQEKGESRITLSMISELHKMLTVMNQEHHSIIIDLKQSHPELTFPDAYMAMFIEEPVGDVGSRPSSIDESQPPHIQG